MRLSPILDASGPALVVLAGVDLLRRLLLGAHRTDSFVVDGPPLLVLAGVLAVALAPHLPRGGRRLARGGYLGLAALALADAAAYWAHLARGGVDRGLVLPASLVFAALFVRAAVRRPATPPSRVVRLGAFAVWILALALLHLHTYGGTDFRRPADAALVFGAKVDARGTPSGALYDRTVTACRLYEDGLVRRIVFSGGRNPAVPLDEPEVMARIAAARGIPREALILDAAGRNTAASIREARRLATAHGWREVLAVSHDVHLARVRMLARREGLAVRTVPAVETVPWPHKFRFVAREVAAWGWWYARSLVSGLCAL